ncbi:hypothetical protein OWV82_006954 [Melia azedarach]|uniref:Uncharacterized protein n=1 Tax=Melia azedarach TaxID=155640 RepID=A0ACC1YIL1_MELAZ|nr:hypothetical protein OWV82_006954 [Melia azedarach]
MLYLHSLKFSGRSHQRSEPTTISNSNTHQVNIKILNFRSSSSSEPSPSPLHYPESRRAAEELLNRPRLAETFPAIAAQAALTLPTIRIRLSTGAAAGRTLTGVGCIATAYGFLAIMRMLLLDNLMLWITGVACLASFPALAATFLR